MRPMALVAGRAQLKARLQDKGREFLIPPLLGGATNVGGPADRQTVWYARISARTTADQHAAKPARGVLLSSTFIRIRHRARAQEMRVLLTGKDDVHDATLWE